MITQTNNSLIALELPMVSAPLFILAELVRSVPNGNGRQVSRHTDNRFFSRLAGLSR